MTVSTSASRYVIPRGAATRPNRGCMQDLTSKPAVQPMRRCSAGCMPGCSPTLAPLGLPTDPAQSAPACSQHMPLPCVDWTIGASCAGRQQVETDHGELYTELRDTTAVDGSAIYADAVVLCSIAFRDTGYRNFRKSSGILSCRVTRVQRHNNPLDVVSDAKPLCLPWWKSCCRGRGRRSMRASA